MRPPPCPNKPNTECKTRRRRSDSVPPPICSGRNIPRPRWGQPVPQKRSRLAMSAFAFLARPRLLSGSRYVPRHLTGFCGGGLPRCSFVRSAQSTMADGAYPSQVPQLWLSALVVVLVVLVAYLVLPGSTASLPGVPLYVISPTAAYC